MVLARFDPGTRTLEHASAGHVPALFFHADGRVEQLGSSGPLLGIFKEDRWTTRTHEFPPGSLLVMLTDGVLEAQDSDRHPVGLSRLVTVLSARAPLDAHGVLTTLREEILRHQGPRPLSDDQTILVAEATAGPAVTIMAAAEPVLANMSTPAAPDRIDCGSTTPRVPRPASWSRCACFGTSDCEEIS